MIPRVVDIRVHGNPLAPGSRAPPQVAERMTAAPDPRSSRRALFRAVYETHYHRVLGYALRRTPSREDAEDAVAETFLIAWRRLEDMPDGRGARPWLYGVARKALANQRRGERRRGRLAGRLHAEPTPTARHPVDPPAAPASVFSAFARLRGEDRELLALAAWEKLDPGEIATVLGCSRNAARIRLHRARRRFAHELEREHGNAAGWSLTSAQALRREPR